VQCGKRLTAAPSRHGPLPSGRTAEAFRHACVCSAVEEDDLPMIGGQIVTKLLRCVFVCRCGKFSQLYPPALVEKHDFVVLGARLAVLDKEEQTALGQRRASSQIHVRRKPLRHCEARLELERDESRPPVVCTQTTSSLSVPALLRADTNLCPARASSGHGPRTRAAEPSEFVGFDENPLNVVLRNPELLNDRSWERQWRHALQLHVDEALSHTYIHAISPCGSSW